ncbi:hypothetical protein CANCADRAFT_2970 [Tortispora caseinolytica NRRL Y-17796]|uniref:Catalase n=1 Tax=Tortispora caseinolytica NRRL Y-17796 TaxID=767744 RepID=A0A1E4THQ0_9ASCO|nr:hypothetical protein CANCADRAFT_2970 [Tortispora caseinolytica NRRL Y-17796]
MSSSKPVYATSNGVPYEGHPYESQRTSDGYLNLGDFHLIDELAHFDRERIPERVVHASGGGAHGFFELTDSLEDVTRCKMLTQVGEKTDLTIRFSTVAPETGGIDTVRDPRGFAIKLRTVEGNMDWVFNNTPIFFIRDPLKFVPFIHSQKRNPKTHMGHGYDSTVFWDYATQNHEILHQFVYLFGDRGIPKSWRKMNGYSGHTFKFINAKNEMVYVQIHVISKQGVEGFTTEEGNKIASQNPDFHKADLYEHIEKGEFPEWDCYIQTMTADQAEKFRYSVNDLTKVWPHKEFPLRKFGRIVLNRNVTNYFAEIEQLAFSPSHLTPGIEASLDPVLQSRLFSYPDTHRYRLGVNYQQLPVNRPRCPFGFGNMQRDGANVIESQGDFPNYFSTYRPFQAQTRDNGFGNEKLDSTAGDFSADKHDGIMRDGVRYFLKHVDERDYEQPRALYMKVFDDGAKQRFRENIINHASTIQYTEIKQRVADMFAILDLKLGEQIAEGLKVDKPNPIPVQPAEMRFIRQ